MGARSSRNWGYGVDIEVAGGCSLGADRTGKRGKRLQTFREGDGTMDKWEYNRRKQVWAIGKAKFTCA